MAQFPYPHKCKHKECNHIIGYTHSDYLLHIKEGDREYVIPYMLLACCPKTGKAYDVDWRYNYIVEQEKDGIMVK